MANYKNQYFTIVAKESGNLHFRVTNNQTYQYSFDYFRDDVQTGDSATTISVNEGDVVFFVGELVPDGRYGQGIGTFYSTNLRFDVEGNIMSLINGFRLDGTSLEGHEYDYAFSTLFENCHVESAENLVLPATTLANYCYNEMFAGSSLTTPPSILPATTLTEYCYFEMFMGCTLLQKAPELPATILAVDCYAYMFQGCTSLEKAPQLPATTLADLCYLGMFRGCRELTKAPVLSATTLLNYCYEDMFYGCASLTEITCYATDISAEECTLDWVNGVASSGTFYKAASMNDWTRSVSGIPVTWNVVDYYEPIYKWERITPVQGDPSTFICDECQVQYRWTATTGYECSGTTKMHREKKQQSEDGETWTDVSPAEYRAALPVIETYSQDCGYVPLERWITVSGAYTCSGTTKMTQYKKQYSYDGGTTWVDSSPLVTKGDLPVIEYDSDDCDLDVWETDGIIRTEGCCPPWDDMTFYAEGNGTTSCTCSQTLDYYNTCPPNKYTSDCANNTFHYYATEICLNSGIEFSGVGEYNIGPFFSYTNVPNIILPDSITTIPFETFYEWSSLEYITIPDSVITIGPCAFGYCVNLHTVVIGSGVREMGLTTSEGPFWYCHKLKNIIFKGTTPPRINKNNFFSHVGQHALGPLRIYVPDEAISAYAEIFDNYLLRPLSLITGV